MFIVTDLVSLSLETPIGVQSVALQSKNIQATSKGSDKAALIRGYAVRTYHIIGNSMSRLNKTCPGLIISLAFSVVTVSDIKMVFYSQGS